jgi:hypothetical protein
MMDNNIHPYKIFIYKNKMIETTSKESALIAKKAYEENYNKKPYIIKVIYWLLEVIKYYFLFCLFFTLGPFFNIKEFDSRIYGRIGNNIGERIWDDIDGKPYNFVNDFIINYKKNKK